MNDNCRDEDKNSHNINKRVNIDKQLDISSDGPVKYENKNKNEVIINVLERRIVARSNLPGIS